MKFINPILTSKGRRIGLALALLFSCAASIIAAPFIVTTTVDNGNNGSPTPGSLRAAINSVNAAVSTAINFNIPTSDPGYNATNNTWTIQPPIDLPNIVNTVTIDGYTQPGSSVNTLTQGDNAMLTIILNGSNYTVGDGYVTGNGLHFAPLVSTSVNGSVVRGLVINQWLDNGILLDATNAAISGVSIVGNFFGTDASGTVQMANRTGIGLGATTTNAITGTLIGTVLLADRNLVAGSFAINYNDSYGVPGAGVGMANTTGTTIVNNYFGLDRTGTLALGNSLCAIQTSSDTNTIIGGTTTLTRNIISGQTLIGIDLIFSTAGLIQGNYIGTDVTGTIPLGNGSSGIALYAAPLNTIINNLISGNGTGITIGDVGLVGSNQNTVRGNKIGTDISGTRALSNTYFGIACEEGLNSISGNIISGNLAGGILFNSTFFAVNNTVSDNIVGLDITGTKKIPNGGPGVQIGLNGGFGGALNNTIGG